MISQRRGTGRAARAAFLLLFGCGSVQSGSVDASGDSSADAPVSCAMGSRACAGQCVANTSPVWAFDDYACGALGGACLTGSTCQNGSCVAAAARGILNTDFTSTKPVGPELVAAAGLLFWGGRDGWSGACMPSGSGCASGGPLGGYFAGATKHLATDGGNFLYYYYPSMDEIWVLDRASTGSHKVTGGAGTANGLAVDTSGNVFFTNAAGQVFVIAGGIGAPSALIPSGPANAQKIVVVGSTLYYTTWGSGATTGEVRAVPIGGGNGAFTPLAVNQAKPTYLAVVNDHVYWTNQGDGTVWSRDITSPTATPTPIASGQAMPLGITADASAVYWVNQGGDVMKAFLCGGGTLRIAMGQGSPAEIVILAGQLYWTAVGANQVVTMPE
jgi:hypothetical protein